VEAYKVVWRRGSHIVYTIGTQMTVSLLALRTGRAVLPRNIFFCFWYSFLLEGEWNPGYSAAGGIKYIEKNSFTSSGLEPTTFLLVAYSLNHYATAVSQGNLIVSKLVQVVITSGLLAVLLATLLSLILTSCPLPLMSKLHTQGWKVRRILFFCNDLRL
jgi:hypothetical protein